MTARATCFLSCLLLAGAAHAGSAPASLSCVSDSGKVALEGEIPSPSSDELGLRLTYAKATLEFTSDQAPGYVVANFQQSVFTLIAPADGQALTLYALPSTVAVKKNANGDVAGTFQAKLLAPRPGGKEGGGYASPLQATLNCDYKYSL
ncbi:hypothetical protein [Achromobacter deleyi]|uniref:hypothetical protein n=1 Tax=Achromobacter deleyi TaxID=1353891 RepID=UPI0014916897|nr:hypothetical protein [Achromobacter deleyi]QVQ25827.1 hypothetical protein HLG70_23645 [Achromobacter deleyi]UIP21367.1 hypothetical protein LYZ39_02310 [Achromobacter deleyi]